MTYYREITVFLLVLTFKGAWGYYDYATNLSTALFTGYDSGILAKCGSNSATEVRLDLAIRQVIELDEPQQILKLNVWVRLKWVDCRLSWNPSDYGNTARNRVAEGFNESVVQVESFRYSDDLQYDDTDRNIVASEFVGLKDFRPNIYSDGSVYYNFPSILESLCPVDVKKFPYDSQTCKLVFGSWAHHGLDFDLVYRYPYGDLSSSEENVEWNITSFTAERHVVYYGCCPEPYPDVTFYLALKRKPNFYVMNLILPSFLITSMASLGFFLPVESGEKVSLQITVMLSLAVFQLLVADSLPPSDNTPLIGTYFNFSLFLVGFACLMAVVVLAIHYQGSRRRVPRVMRTVFLRWLAKVTCVWDTEHNPNKVKQTEVIVSTTPVTKSTPVRKFSKSKLITVNAYDENKTKDKIINDTGGEIGGAENEKTSGMSTQDEWRMLAIVIDRLSCYIFVIILAIGTGIIFARFKSD